MMADHFPDLTIRPLDGGSFELEQAWGVDDPERLEIHPAQIRLLAERAGLLPQPDPKLLERMSRAHIRRVRELRERFDEFASHYWDEIIERCGDGIEISLHLRAIDSLLGDLMAELEDDEPVLPPETGAAKELRDPPAQTAPEARHATQTPSGVSE